MPVVVVVARNASKLAVEARNESTRAVVARNASPARAVVARNVSARVVARNASVPVVVVVARNASSARASSGSASPLVTRGGPRAGTMPISSQPPGRGTAARVASLVPCAPKQLRDRRSRSCPSRHHRVSSNEAPRGVFTGTSGSGGGEERRRSATISRTRPSRPERAGLPPRFPVSVPSEETRESFARLPPPAPCSPDGDRSARRGEPRGVPRAGERPRSFRRDARRERGVSVSFAGRVRDARASADRLSRALDLAPVVCFRIGSTHARRATG